jgi:hypothetical protein
VVTPPHHDSEGQNTFVTGKIGLKMWVPLRHVKGDNLEELAWEAASLCGNHDMSKFKAETVTIAPGDML